MFAEFRRIEEKSLSRGKCEAGYQDGTPDELLRLWRTPPRVNAETDVRRVPTDCKKNRYPEENAKLRIGMVRPTSYFACGELHPA
ncbi:MAG: hypothetical protein WBQ23_00755, partial [Bacteroidota bacterium]